MVLGTAAYMSPEQARGKIAGKRADIWAFGCVLYELLAGRRAFEADEVADVLARVLTQQPDWSRAASDRPGGNPEAPPPLPGEGSEAPARRYRRCAARNR